MFTLLYSLAGIAALISISALFNFLGIRRNNKIAKRLAAIRNACVLAPGVLLNAPSKPHAVLVPVDHIKRNWKVDPIRKTYGTFPAL